MMTDDPLRSHVDDIIAWWPILDELQSAAYRPGSSGRTNASGVRSPNPDSSTVIAAIKLEQIHSIRLHVELLAHEWGWRPGNGPHHLYLLARLDWARTHLPAEHAGRITFIHSKLQTLVREGPLPVDRVCPACGSDHLSETVTGQLWCDTCQLVREESELKALTLYRLTTHEATMTPREAAAVLDIPEQTIYSWIRRGHLTRHNGHINITEAKNHYDRQDKS